MINTRCPGCQKLLKMKPELAGKKVKCPNCGQPVRVPVPVPAQEPEAVVVAEAETKRAAPAPPPVVLEVAEVEEVEAVEEVTPARPRVHPDPLRPQRGQGEDGPPPAARKVPFPASVTMAGLLWILFGLACIGISLVSVVLIVNAQNKPQTNTVAKPAPGSGQASNPQEQGLNPYGVGVIIGLVLRFLFGVAFLIAGVQSMNGTARGTMRTGVSSIVLGIVVGGLIALNFAIKYMDQTVDFSKTDVEGEVLNLIIGAVLCGLLLLGGLLGISGHSRYVEWRTAEKARKAAAKLVREEGRNGR
jgi:hypothetical protein